MKKYLIILLGLILFSCTKKEGDKASPLDSLNLGSVNLDFLDKKKYFSEEVLTGNYQELYGL